MPKSWGLGSFPRETLQSPAWAADLGYSAFLLMVQSVSQVKSAAGLPLQWFSCSS